MKKKKPTHDCVPRSKPRQFVTVFDAVGTCDPRTAEYLNMAGMIQDALENGRVGDVSISPVGRVPWGLEAIRKTMDPDLVKFLYEWEKLVASVSG